MWSFRDLLPPATVLLDGARAGAGRLFCWSSAWFSVWSPEEGWLVLPALEERPAVVRWTGHGFLVICDLTGTTEHDVAFWRPGETDWAWHGKLPRILVHGRTRCLEPNVATGGTLLGISEWTAPRDAFGCWRLGETSLESLGRVEMGVARDELFIGGATDADGALLALTQDRGHRLRADGTRPSLEPLWAVQPPYLRPALPPFVVGRLVVFPRKDGSPPRVFDLEQGEISGIRLLTVEGARGLWTACVSGDSERTTRLVDDLSGAPRPVADATPLEFLEGPEGVVAVATTRGVGVHLRDLREVGAPFAPGGLYPSDELLAWRAWFPLAGRSKGPAPRPQVEAAEGLDSSATLVRNASELTRRLLDRIQTIGGDPGSRLPNPECDLLRTLADEPFATAAAGEIRRALESSDPPALVAALRAAVGVPALVDDLFSPGTDPGPGALSRTLVWNESRVVLAALHAAEEIGVFEALRSGLMAALCSADPVVRRKTLVTITAEVAGNPPFRPLVSTLFRSDPDPGIRESAFLRLRCVALPRTGVDLLEALGDLAPSVRSAASRDMAELSGEEWSCTLGSAVDRLLLAVQDGKRRPGPEAATALKAIVDAGIPGMRDSVLEEGVEATADLASILYLLFAFAWIDVPPEEDELETLVTTALERCGDRGDALRSCRLEVFRNGFVPRSALEPALALARLEPDIGRRCVLFALAGRKDFEIHGSVPPTTRTAEPRSVPLHLRLKRLGRDLPEEEGLALLRSAAESDDSFSLVALWFLASRGEPSAFIELRRRLPAACATWRTVVPAWAVLSPDEETTNAGLRGVLLSPAVPAAIRLQIQLELLPDPLADGHGADLLPYFEEVARDESIPFNERREAALHARRAGNSRPLVDLWASLTARPPGDFPDDAREDDLAGAEAIP